MYNCISFTLQSYVTNVGRCRLFTFSRFSVRQKKVLQKLIFAKQFKLNKITEGFKKYITKHFLAQRIYILKKVLRASKRVHKKQQQNWLNINTVAQRHTVHRTLQIQILSLKTFFSHKGFIPPLLALDFKYLLACHTQLTVFFV